MTDGLDVLVHEVMAAITTEPWRSTVFTGALPPSPSLALLPLTAGSSTATSLLWASLEMAKPCQVEMKGDGSEIWGMR